MTSDPEIANNLRIVVNNVGLAPLGEILKSDPEAMDNALKVNHYPIVLLSKFAKNQFIQDQKNSDEPSGKRYGIVNVSSFSGIRPIIRMSLYGPSKRFDLMFSNISDQINQEKNHDSIDTISLCPGLTKTPMTTKMKHTWYKSCEANESAEGTIKDLG